MPDATSLTTALSPLLPLRIQQAAFDDGSTLTVVGELWSLTLLGDWAWCRGDVLVTDAEQPGAEDASVKRPGSTDGQGWVAVIMLRTRWVVQLRAGLRSRRG